ncbi:MAG: DNA/RNA nuclease SfsA [Deltaproteobacteria bacterium]|nr:DNA/RNA nuclease SfsA [Deltaproteobacteria bacterium]
MRYDPPLLSGRLQRRYQRFFVDVRLDDGRQIVAHTNNTGRMTGCLVPQSRVFVAEHNNPKRKLRYSLEIASAGRSYVCVNTTVANRLVADAVNGRRLKMFDDFDTVRREVGYGERSRVDLLLSSPDDQRCYVEVKSVTLAERGIALFPDAPSERARRHAEELARVVSERQRAAMVFVIQRGDCRAFAPADAIDPAYGAALRQAQARGVELYALSSVVRRHGVRLRSQLVPLCL